MKTLILDGMFVYQDLPQCFNNKRSIDLIYDKAKKNNFDRYYKMERLPMYRMELKILLLMIYILLIF